MSDEQKKEKKYPKAVAGVFIVNSKGEIFLTRAPHWSNKLVIPGGHINYRETSQQAAVREIKEETGLDIKDLEFLRMKELTEPLDYGKNQAHIVAFNYKARLIDENQEVVLDSREASEYLWLKPEDIVKRDDVEETTKSAMEEFFINKEKHGLFHRECKKCEELKKESAEYKAGWQRATADYQNLKKETEARRGEWARMSEAQILEEFIPVYENFKAAFSHLPLMEGESQRGCEQWAQGIEHIKKQFAEILKAHGVEEIKTVGEKFDPKYHEAAGHQAVEGKSEGEIIKEVSGGYKVGERVIRAAKVIVSK